MLDGVDTFLCWPAGGGNRRWSRCAYSVGRAYHYGGGVGRAKFALGRKLRTLKLNDPYFLDIDMLMIPESQLAQPNVRPGTRGGVLHRDGERGVRGEREYRHAA